MKNTAKLVCLALFATVPLAYASAAWSETTPKKHVVKTKVKKHAVKTKAKKHKARVKKSATPRIVARTSTSSNRIVAKPQATAPALTASQPLEIPAAAVAAIQPVAVMAASTASPNPYMAQPYAAVKSVNPYLPPPPMPWPVQQVAAPTVNPYLASRAPAPAAAAMAAPLSAPLIPSNPYLAVPMPAPAVNPASASTNPYLASAASAAPLSVPVETYTQHAVAVPQLAQPAPAVAPSPAKAASPGLLASLDPKQGLSDLFGSVRNSIPLLNDQDLLPTIKKVYPTGEKPLVILSFKCPTEMIGVTPPPMKALHELINLGFDGLNKTNMLSFNLQQVCN